MNLIPNLIPQTCNYWCTWDTQWNVLKERLPTGQPIPTRDGMDEDFLFGEEGVLNGFQGMRQDLIALLDDGWDAPYGTTDHRIFGALETDAERFPSLHGTPSERLKALSDRVKAMGYRGLGLWIPAQMPHEEKPDPDRDLSEDRAHWEERARWCHEAGVLYWKVDWGSDAGSARYRAMMTECARKYAPGLIVEHALVGMGLFASEAQTAKERKWMAEYLPGVLPVSDCLRTYDVAPEFKYSSTLYRAAECFREAAKVEGDCAILNVEDVDLIGAALGCSLGVMRHEQEQQMQKLTYPYRPMLESLRALRWHRIAPPFPANRGEILFSEAWLTDEWHYPVRDAGLWPNVSDVTKQFSAPAIIARNMPLPEVQATGETPFVVCSTHPDTHALSVAVVPRTLPDQLYVTPAATIRVCCADPDAPMGLFGHWQSVELVFDRPAKGQRVWGQDLASEEAVELTGQVQLTGTGLIVPAAVLKALTQNGDHEDALPGIVLRVME